MSKGVKAVGRFLISASGRAVQLIGGFGAILLMVAILDPVQVGLFYLISAAGISIQFIALSFLFFGIQRLMPERSDDADFVRTLFSPTVSVALIAIGLSFLLHNFPGGLARVMGIAISVIGFSFGEALFAQVTNYTSSRSNQHEYLAAVVIRTFGILSGLGIAWAGRSTLDGVLVANLYTAWAVVAGLVSSRAIRHGLLRGRFQRAYLAEGWRFALPYMAAQLLRQPLERGDRMIVGLFFGPTLAGQYSIACDLARRVIQGLAVNVRLVLGRKAILAFDAGETQELRTTLQSMAFAVMLVGLPLAGLISGFGEYILAPVFGEKLSPIAFSILRVVGVAFLLESFRMYAVDIVFELVRKTKVQLYIAAGGLVAQAIGYATLGRHLGVVGLAYSLVLTHLVVTLAASWFASRLSDEAPKVNICLALGAVALAPYFALGAFAHDRGVGLLIGGMVCALLMSLIPIILLGRSLGLIALPLRSSP